jgi:hypothetical protein
MVRWAAIGARASAPTSASKTGRMSPASTSSRRLPGWTRRRGYGLVDSPAGLAAWIIEKLWSWAYHDGDLSTVLSRDELLDNLMLYWLPGTGASSARLYWESIRQVNEWISGAVVDTVDVPVGCSIFPRDCSGLPGDGRRSTSPISATGTSRPGAVTSRLSSSRNCSSGRCGRFSGSFGDLTQLEHRMGVTLVVRTARTLVARASLLGAFTAGKGYCDDAAYRPPGLADPPDLSDQGTATRHTGWVRRVRAHPRIARGHSGGRADGVLLGAQPSRLVQARPTCSMGPS